MRETGDKGRRPSPYPRTPQDKSSRAMTRRGGNRKRYIAGLSVAAVVAAVTAGMMTTGNAYAEGGDDTVVFNGHCGLIGLGQASKPDKDSVTVMDGDKVTFVNNLGTKATLLLGQEQVNVPKGGEYTAVLSSTSEAVMAPDCLTNVTEQADVVTVTVVAGPDEDSGNNSGGDSGNSGNNGSDNSGNGDSGDQSGDGNVGTPDGGQAPLDGDGPAAEDAVPEPDGEKDTKDDTAATDETDETDASGTTDTATSGNDQVEAVDVGTIEETGTSGVLALLATVCLVGVAVAAIRTMRVSRAAQ